MGSPAMMTDGAPSDCVALAVLGFLPEKVDLVVSGINPLPNLGHDITYSGTVTAAMEAAIWGLKGLAFSLDGSENHGEADYAPAAAVAQKVVESVLQNDLPANILLSVNVPALPLDEIKGYRMTRQGLRIYHDTLVYREDPRGRPYYWIGGDAPSGVPDDGTDIGALAEGYVSITPVQLDLTAHHLLQALEAWRWPPLQKK